MKELEDLSFFPPLLRNFQTEFIGHAVSRFNYYRAFCNYINSRSLPPGPMFDLCSGSGQPAIGIFQRSNCFTHLVLSDKFPNKISIDDKRIRYKKRSMDVLKMEFRSEACYTMFNAFHHFTDADKIIIVKRILAARSKGFIVEILEPGILSFLKILFITTAGNLVLTPCIRPFSPARLVFTYVIPINIFTICFDGLISVIKSRSFIKYRELFREFENSVRVHRLKAGLGPLIVIEIGKNEAH